MPSCNFNDGYTILTGVDQPVNDQFPDPEQSNLPDI
jgi:hypothetical protein